MSYTLIDTATMLKELCENPHKRFMDEGAFQIVRVVDGEISSTNDIYSKQIPISLDSKWREFGFKRGDIVGLNVKQDRMWIYDHADTMHLICRASADEEVVRHLLFAYPYTSDKSTLLNGCDRYEVLYIVPKTDRARSTHTVDAAIIRNKYEQVFAVMENALYMLRSADQREEDGVW